jgi:hypothetical protein
MAPRDGQLANAVGYMAAWPRAMFAEYFSVSEKAESFPGAPSAVVARRLIRSARRLTGERTRSRAVFARVPLSLGLPRFASQ